MKKTTFAEILKDTKAGASESAWNRARLASGLRHLCFKQHNHKASNLLGLIKKEALKLALYLNPA